MTRLLLCAILALAIALNTACDGGPAPVPPLLSTFTVLKSGDSLGIRAPEDSADPGTAVTITSGGTGSGTAAADGSVTFKATATDGPLIVSYTKAGQPLTSELTVAPLSSLVSTPHFGTGSAPNDMELVDGSLFVVNSLDNTLASYSLTGSVQDSFSFPQFASPSYLAFDSTGSTLTVIRNGDNFVSSFLSATLDPVGTDFPLSGPAATFIGPGKPAIWSDYLFIPRAQVETFGPTTYGNGVVDQLDLTDSGNLRQLATSGKNVVSVAIEPMTPVSLTTLYVLSAGDLQFDDEFHPYVNSDSYLDIFVTNSANDTFNLYKTINLGRIGASSIALRENVLQGPNSDYAAYIGSLLTGDLHKVNLALPSPTVVPISLTDEFTYISDLEFVPGTDLLLATSFNTDELYVVDTATDTVSPAPYPGPFQVSPDPELLAGAIAVEVDAEGHAYVLLSIANAVARVDLLP